MQGPGGEVGWGLAGREGGLVEVGNPEKKKGVAVNALPWGKLTDSTAYVGPLTLAIGQTLG